MTVYQNILNIISENKKGLAILIDPEKFLVSETRTFLKKIPKDASHIFIGGSTGLEKELEEIVTIDITRSEKVRRWWPFLRDRRIDVYDSLLKRFDD